MRSRFDWCGTSWTIVEVTPDRRRLKFGARTSRSRAFGLVMAPDAALAFSARHDLAALIVSRAAAGGLEERLSPALRAMLD